MLRVMVCNCLCEIYLGTLYGENVNRGVYSLVFMNDTMLKSSLISTCVREWDIKMNVSGWPFGAIGCANCIFR